MTQHTISSRDFNQDVTNAKRAADEGPVIITDRGKPSYVLLNIEEYQLLTATGDNIVQMLAMPKNDIEFEPAIMSAPFTKPVDLS